MACLYEQLARQYLMQHVTTTAGCDVIDTPNDVMTTINDVKLKSYKNVTTSPRRYDTAVTDLKHAAFTNPNDVIATSRDFAATSSDVAATSHDFTATNCDVTASSRDVTATACHDFNAACDQCK